MPFVQRVVSPKYLSRVSLHDENGKPRVRDDELDAVTNFTLCSALRQLASVVQIAGEIFHALNRELNTVGERSGRLKERIVQVEQKVQDFDPKAVTVPESDLTDFWHVKGHYESQHETSSCLFTSQSRPESVQKLYEAAASPPKLLRRQGSVYNVTPVLGPRSKRNVLPDIEARKPAVINHLRRWTSSEALGSVTVDPDCTLKVSSVYEDVTDHTLPSPEEQVQAVALKFPPEVVVVDVTGKNFERMSSLRRSLMSGDEAVKRRSSKRRPKGKRRNTIAGTDTTKELADIVGDSSDINQGKTSPEETVSINFEKKSHLENLKEWGRSRLRLIKNSDSSVKLRATGHGRRKLDKEEPCPHSSSGNWSQSSESGHSTATSHIPRSSISSGSVCPKHKRPPLTSASSSVTSESTTNTLTPDDGETCSMYSCDTEGYYTSFHLDSGLKTLREEEPPAPSHATSALSVNSQNNSTLTAESEYELFGKGSTSTTASSAGTVCTTLLIPPPPTVPERLCSQLSGNNTLPERTTKSNLDTRETQSLKLTKKPDMKMLSFDEIKEMSEQKSNLTRDNVSKHDDSGRKNCIITVDVHHELRKTPEKCGDSPDSGHNTCSSPVDSIASPSLDLEMSECSDLEGIERVERIREKTTINSSRIPSMCVITPPQSDDETSISQYNRSIDSGEYVTIAEANGQSSPVMYSSPTGTLTRDQELISLVELPKTDADTRRRGARVTLNAEGKVVYSSDSLKRRKAIHTTETFEPGPCVALSTQSPVPHRNVAVRPVNTASPLFANRKVITPNPIHRSPSKPHSPLVAHKDVVPLKHPIATITACRTLSPPSSRKLNNQKQFYSPNSDHLNQSMVCKPVSPLASPGTTNTIPLTRTMSPRMVVKASPGGRSLSPVAVRGAYVNINQPSQDDKYAVKRSDSYRLANDEVYDLNPGAKKSHSSIGRATLLSAVQAARTTKEGSSDMELYAEPRRDWGNSPKDCSGQSTWPRSTSTPTRSSALSPSMDFTTVPSPIQKTTTPPKTARSAMDLFAVIHESKKRIQNLQKPKPVPVWPKVIPAKSVSTSPPSTIDSSLINEIPKPMPPMNNVTQRKYAQTSNMGYNSLPRLQVQKLDESPRNMNRKVYSRRELIPSSPAMSRPQDKTSLASDRMGPSPPTSRNDFKRLLLQKGWSNSPSKESAVERLKGRATAHIKPINYDVLSSTIPEDRSDEDELNETLNKAPSNLAQPSTFAVKATINAPGKSKSTLETAL